MFLNILINLLDIFKKKYPSIFFEYKPHFKYGIFPIGVHISKYNISKKINCVILAGKNLTFQEDDAKILLEYEKLIEILYSYNTATINYIDDVAIDPINTLTSISQTLFELPNLTPQQMDQINLLFECSFQITDIIGNLKDFFNIQCKPIKLYITSFNLTKMLQNVNSILYFKLVENSINLQINSPTSINIVADQKRIEQILINILLIFIKITPKFNSIILNVNVTNNKIYFIVYNTTETTLNIPNNLPLFISRYLIKLMGGGQLHIKSDNKIYWNILINDTTQQYNTHNNLDTILETLSIAHVWIIHDDPKIIKKIKTCLNIFKNAKIKTFNSIYDIPTQKNKDVIMCFMETNVTNAIKIKKIFPPFTLLVGIQNNSEYFSNKQSLFNILLNKNWNCDEIQKSILNTYPQSNNAPIYQNHNNTNIGIIDQSPTIITSLSKHISNISSKIIRISTTQKVQHLPHITYNILFVGVDILLKYHIHIQRKINYKCIVAILNKQQPNIILYKLSKINISQYIITPFNQQKINDLLKKC
jgi:hypothetical protein